MNKFLDDNLCNNLREVINRTNIFFKDSEQSKKFNFICAIMDRFDFAVNYFNKNLDKPSTEIEFMTYLMQTSIIKDGINYCYKVLDLSQVTGNNIFKPFFERDLECDNLNYSDDEFFEYFRSLAFAHPFKTDKSIPNSIEKEIQYSPYCLLNLYSFKEDNNAIGVYVYSNKRKAFSITFPFETLKEYIQFKFNLITNIIEAFNNIITDMKSEWKKHKVNRQLDSVGILKDIRNILKERYMEHYLIDELIDYLDCELTDKSNQDNVSLFREKIVDLIPELCDAVDELNEDGIYSISHRVLNVRPKAHSMMYYQLEKIFCYLTDDNYGDVEWGLVQADEFSKGFAKKWVNMKPREMSFKEIRLLTSVACYLEYMEQNGSDENE